MAGRKSIDEFLGKRKVAVVGVSRSGHGFGHMAWRALLQKGYEALPVHPVADAIDGVACYHRLADLPPDVGGVLIVVPPAETEKVVREADAAGIRRIWMQQGSESADALAYCSEHGIDAVSHECILMFAQPCGGIHKLHRWIWGALGKLPA